MTNKPSLIFDLDGTLIDVRKRYWTVYKTVVENLGGKPLSINLYWRKKRTYSPIEQILAYSFPKSPPPKDKYLSQFINLIEQPEFLLLDTPFPYTYHTLDHLRASYQLHIVTVRMDKHALLQQVDSLKLTQYFNTVLTATSGPDPAQTKMSLITKNTLRPIAIIGDTQADIDAAHGLSIISIAVTSGLRNRSFLKTHNPTHCISDIRGVVTILTP